MKSRMYKLLFLLLNGSFCYSQILTVKAFYKNSKMIVPGAHVSVFGEEISGEIFNDIASRFDFFNFINQEVFIKRKIVRYLTPFL